MILGMMSGNRAADGATYWFYGPVAENGAAGGSQAFYLRTSDPSNWSVSLRPLPPALTSLARISSANGAVFFVQSAGVVAVSFDNGATWSSCSGLTADTTEDFWWNGDYYWHNRSRSADGITWEAAPNIPSGALIKIARQSDGAVVSHITDTGDYAYTLNNGTSWTTASVGTGKPDTISTDGTRIVFNRSTLGRYTDNLFSSVQTPTNYTYNQYSSYWTGARFLFKTDFTVPRVVNLNDGSEQGSILVSNTGSRNEANVFGSGGVAIVVATAGGSPRQNQIFLSPADGEAFGLVATVYGTSSSVCNTGQRP